MTATHLIDTSVLSRAWRSPVRERLEPLVRRGVLAICAVVELEFLLTARDAAEYRASREHLGASFALAPIEQPILARALEVQGAFAPGARHRGIAWADLVIAACAERAGLTVLHYDAHFDAIAEVTGQPVEWVVPRGTAEARQPADPPAQIP